MARRTSSPAGADRERGAGRTAPAAARARGAQRALAARLVCERPRRTRQRASPKAVALAGGRRRDLDRRRSGLARAPEPELPTDRASGRTLGARSGRIFARCRARPRDLAPVPARRRELGAACGSGVSLRWSRRHGSGTRRAARGIAATHARGAGPTRDARNGARSRSRRRPGAGSCRAATGGSGVPARSHRQHPLAPGPGPTGRVPESSGSP